MQKIYTRENGKWSLGETEALTRGNANGHSGKRKPSLEKTMRAPVKTAKHSGKRKSFKIVCAFSRLQVFL